MAKSIRSKAKRKLRTVKREKIIAKERLRLIAIKEREEGVKMDGLENATTSSDIRKNTASLDFEEHADAEMEAPSSNQTVVDTGNKNDDKSYKWKKVKRLDKKKRKKYKW